jgi:hypothetical protein
MVSVFVAPLWEMARRIGNFYSDIDLKGILRDGSSQTPFELGTIRKIEYVDLLKTMDEYFKLKYPHMIEKQRKKMVGLSVIKEEDLLGVLEFIYTQKSYLIKDIQQ